MRSCFSSNAIQISDYNNFYENHDSDKLIKCVVSEILHIEQTDF